MKQVTESESFKAAKIKAREAQQGSEEPRTRGAEG